MEVAALMGNRASRTRHVDTRFIFGQQPLDFGLISILMCG
jgi:hypothetical protein